MTSEISTHRFLTTDEIRDGLSDVAGSPSDLGKLEMIVARPEVDARLTPETGRLTIEDGLIGDRWKSRSSKKHGPNADQLTLINSRFLDHIAGGDRARWSQAGDQLVVDLDIGVENLPAGTMLKIGEALTEVTSKPHTGCSKFSSRFGEEARAFAMSDAGSQMRLRGMYVRVIVSGDISVGDRVAKVDDK